MAISSNYWAIVPAAGIGKRMGSEIPKQYLPLAGKTLLEITLRKLDAVSRIKGVIVAIAADDIFFSRIKDLPKNVSVIEGGKERADSVLSGLEFLCEHGFEQDWAVVHDAARPCVNEENILRLMKKVENENRGGILAAPVADTLKKVENRHIQETVDRQMLWQAHTPQIFPVKKLRDAISRCLQDGIKITDEASALEYIGETPIVVEDSRDNIKVTHAEDLALAEFVLSRQMAN